MLSDKQPNKKSLPIRAADSKTNRHWSDKQKLEAVQSYLMLGNLALTGRILNIPEITLRVWKTSDWWKTAIAEIRSQEKIELTAKMKKIVQASLDVVEDRLTNGDFQFDQKTGAVVRKPVNMKDAHRVAVDLHQRQEVLEKTDGEVHTEENQEAKLLKLAEKFAEMATKKIDQIASEHRTIDVEDAVVKE